MTSIVPSCLLSGGGPAFRPGKEKIIDSKQIFSNADIGEAFCLFLVDENFNWSTFLMIQKFNW